MSENGEVNNNWQQWDINSRKKERWDKIAIVFIAPYLLSLGLFLIYPMFMAFSGSVSQWNILQGEMTWVGFGNYVQLFKDPLFYMSIRNTFIYFVVQIPLSIIGGILVANLLNQRIIFRVFFRGIYFLPIVTGAVVLSIVWSWIYSETSGVLNYLLSLVGVRRISWLHDQRLSMLSISLMKVWTDVGFYTVVFLAALQSIPSDYIEAAHVDGASSSRIFFKIKLPLLNPTIVFSIIMGTIWGMQLFTEPFMMTGGGPLGSSTTLTLFLYRQGFVFSKMGYASTIGVVTAMLILFVSVLQRKIFERSID